MTTIYHPSREQQTTRPPETKPSVHEYPAGTVPGVEGLRLGTLLLSIVVGCAMWALLFLGLFALLG